MQKWHNIYKYIYKFDFDKHNTKTQETIANYLLQNVATEITAYIKIKDCKNRQTNRQTDR